PIPPITLRRYCNASTTCNKGCSASPYRRQRPPSSTSPTPQHFTRPRLAKVNTSLPVLQSWYSLPTHWPPTLRTRFNVNICLQLTPRFSHWYRPAATSTQPPSHDSHALPFPFSPTTSPRPTMTPPQAFFTAK